VRAGAAPPAGVTLLLSEATRAAGDQQVLRAPPCWRASTSRRGRRNEVRRPGSRRQASRRRACRCRGTLKIYPAPRNGGAVHGENASITASRRDRGCGSGTHSIQGAAPADRLQGRRSHQTGTEAFGSRCATTRGSGRSARRRTPGSLVVLENRVSVDPYDKTNARTIEFREGAGRQKYHLPHQLFPC
jgi:hypothetical protein